MSGELDARIAALRRDFDAAFAVAPPDPHSDSEDFLSVRAGGMAYAVPVRELAGFYADKRWQPLPGGAAGLLGIAGFRGVLAPVYDLAALLGHGNSASPRWLVLSKGENAYALAFEAMEGHARVRRSEITIDEARRTSEPVSAYLRNADGTRGVLDLQVLRRIIEERVERANANKG